MLFHYPMSSVFEVDIGEEKYMRGIAAIQNYLCIGTSISKVLVFNCSDLTEGGDFPLAHSLSTDDYGVPISAIAASSSSSSGGVLAVGNDTGKLFGYRSDEAFAGAFTFEGYGHPVTALAVNDQVLIAAYSSGHIRLFRTDIVELAIELTAHTRIVSGLLVGPGADYFISCSQDQYVHVWSLPDFRSRGGSEIGLIYSELLENKICSGVAELSDNRFAVACYDDDEITIFNRN
jgi:WD40 repeat protein